MNTSDSPSPQRQFNTKLGLLMFFIYLALYTGFVLINAFAADRMETIVLAGLNLAIVYGFGLILFALVLAFIYGLLCKSEPLEDLTSTKAATTEEDSK
ncbi:MAG: DUF485 domain-containing protein [Rubripirellula sp.]|nr:DUF485 domain-containing protein [Rubripirellula sp.]